MTWITMERVNIIAWIGWKVVMEGIHMSDRSRNRSKSRSRSSSNFDDGMMDSEGEGVGGDIEDQVRNFNQNEFDN
jgi:hypothetical protein